MVLQGSSQVFAVPFAHRLNERGTDGFGSPKNRDGQKPIAVLIVCGRSRPRSYRCLVTLLTGPKMRSHMHLICRGLTREVYMVAARARCGGRCAARTQKRTNIWSSDSRQRY